MLLIVTKVFGIRVRNSDEFKYIDRLGVVREIVEVLVHNRAVVPRIVPQLGKPGRVAQFVHYHGGQVEFNSRNVAVFILFSFVVTVRV